MSLVSYSNVRCTGTYVTKRNFGATNGTQCQSWADAVYSVDGEPRALCIAHKRYLERHGAKVEYQSSAAGNVDRKRRRGIIESSLMRRRIAGDE